MALTGPAYRPAARDLAGLAIAAVQGHAAIAAAVEAHRERVAAEHAAQRTAAGAERAASALAALPASERAPDPG